MDRLSVMVTALESVHDCATLDERQPDRALDLSGSTGPSAQERMARIVRTIEADIIPRLVRAHRGEAAEGLLPVLGGSAGLAAEVPGFTRQLLSEDDGGWMAAVDTLVAQGVAVDDICLDLLQPAARELGRLWEDDRISFCDVTVGVGRLQRLMRLLGPALGAVVTPAVELRRVLLLPAPGDQHTFGLTIVAEFFRRAGWDVVGHCEERSADPSALVRSEWFDIVGISVGSDSRLDWLRSGIGAMRHASRNREIGVWVGGPMFVADPTRAQALGADGTAPDGRQAPVMAEQWLRGRQDAQTLRTAPGGA